MGSGNGRGKGNGDGCCKEDLCSEGGGYCGLCTPKKDRLDVNRGRSCQDVPIAVLFLGVIAATAFVAWWALENGDARRVVYGEDSYGNTCGFANELRIDSPNSGLDLTLRNNLYYTLSNSGRKLCLAGCPTATTVCAFDEATCQDAGVCIGQGTSGYNSQTIGETEACPESLVSSSPIPVFNYCVPYKSLNDTFLAEYTSEINNVQDYNIILADFYASRTVLMIALVGSIVASMFLIFLMRWFAGFVVISTLVLSVLLLLGCTGAMWYISYEEQRELDRIPDDEQTEADQYSVQIFWGATAVITLLSMIYTCLICAMRNRVLQAITIFKRTAGALMMMPSLFLCPAITNVLILCWLGVWLIISLYIVTSGTPIVDEVTGYIEYEDHDQIQYIWLFMIFSLFWGIEVVRAAANFCISSSFVINYLSHGPDGSGDDGIPLVRSMYRLFRYHFGSVAFGALLIAIIQTFRVVLEFLKHKLEGKDDNPAGRCAKFCLSCCSCCLACLQRCVSFINDTAYIEIAIWGDGFCSSACRGLHIMLEYATLVGTVNGVGWLLTTIINLVVSLGAGAVSYYFLLRPEEESLVFVALIVIFIVVTCYIISTMFTGLYSVGAESIMICMIEDEKDGNKSNHMTEAERDAWDIRSEEERNKDLERAAKEKSEETEI